jgi:hypothetical protein
MSQLSLKETAPMAHPRYSGEEIGKRGQEIYESQLRARVETPENIGAGALLRKCW